MHIWFVPVTAAEEGNKLSKNAHKLIEAPFILMISPAQSGS